MPYRPGKQSQFEPLTDTSKRDCIPATVAYLVERATVGRIASNHKIIRDQATKAGYPTTAGLTLTAGALAAKALYSIDIEVRRHVSASVLFQTVELGQAVGVTVQCPPWVIFPGSTYSGAHEVYLNSATHWPKGETCSCEKHSSAAHDELTVEDPGSVSAGYRQVSLDLVMRAANGVTGGLGANLLIAPDTEGVKRRAITSAYIRVSPDRAAKALGRLVINRDYYVPTTANGAGGEGWHRLASGGYVPGSSLR